MQRSISIMVAILIIAGVLEPSRLDAKNGATLTVTTTTTVSGSLVQGVVAITNGSTQAVSVSSITDVLEVRYPTGALQPALPPGVTSGSFAVATRSLPVPVIPPLATVSVPYSFDTCTDQVAKYQGAKDMRNTAVVTAGAQYVEARSASFVPPSQAYCPVCGNHVREGSEQCDGGGCCTSACAFAADGTSCSDGNACTTIDSCQGGACMGADTIQCVASDQCHVAGACDPSTGTCSNPPRANGTSCDDDDACSTGDVCADGSCLGTPLACDDGNVCTTDSCSAGACAHVNNTAPCDDGSICTDQDACVDGTCVGGPPLNCDDFQACTEDACREDVGCAHAATATCPDCFQNDCLACRDHCTTQRTECSDGCWTGFFGCLNHCTSTYCAPFCQVDLGFCLDACPTESACFASCDTGNGCADGCAVP